MENSFHFAQRINVGDSLTRTAAAHPHRLAIVDGERRWTYIAFNAWVNRIAHVLAGHGYGPGDRLALASGNSAEFLAVYYACAKRGVICVPINLGWRPDETGFVLRHSGAQVLVAESHLVDALESAVVQSPGVREVLVVPGTHGPYTAEDFGVPVAALPELVENAPQTEPEVRAGDRDPLSYLYTSGTTSAPKGVATSHIAVYLESMSVALDSGWQSDDRFAAMMPMFHTAQLNAFCTPAVMVGATIHVLRAFDPTALLDAIEQHRLTQLFALPAMYRALLDDPTFPGRDLTTLRRAVYAMTPMPDELIRRCLTSFRCHFALLFGQTEMSPVTTLFRPHHQLSHMGAVGTPLTGVQVGIMGPDGALLPGGSEGEIVYRGPSTMNGYVRDAEATQEAFAHGWFHSGDVGRFDEDGVLWFVDRHKDVIKSAGENVASIEVEKAIYAADSSVAEAVVIGLPHERWIEAVTAVIVPHPGTDIDPDRLIATLKKRLDGFKVPKAVIVTDSLPKTSTGKTQKNIVRDRYASHYGG